MKTAVRSIVGAALLLTGASAAMAASGNQPVAGQSVQTGTTTATAASNNVAIAGQPGQTGASAPSNTAAVAGQPQKSNRSGVSDNNDPYGGHDPNSPAGTRAFFEPQY
jgi:hypothetical protein